MQICHKKICKNKNRLYGTVTNRIIYFFVAENYLIILLRFKKSSVQEFFLFSNICRNVGNQDKIPVDCKNRINIITGATYRIMIRYSFFL